MCEIASNGTLAFAFIAKEETIKYAQVVSESLGIPLLAVGLESKGEKKIKAVQKGLTGGMEAKMTVDIGHEIIGERYIVSILMIFLDFFEIFLNFIFLVFNIIFLNLCQIKRKLFDTVITCK